MLDENLDPYLIEVNHAPSFATESNLDLRIKRLLLQDTFRLLNMSLKRRSKYKKEYNKVAQNRILTGRKDTLTLEDKERTRKLNNITRHRFEMSNLGGYQLLYPIVDSKNRIVYDKN